METEPHILVVDDDRGIRDLLSRYLRKNGLRVDVAANGREMESRLSESKIDLVVLDRVMPGEDGLTLCRDLRNHSRVPIIMLTLLGADTDRILGLQMGAELWRWLAPIQFQSRVWIRPNWMWPQTTPP